MHSHCQTAVSMSFTKHAAQRAQQRAIPPEMVALLLGYGEVRDQKSGTQVLQMSRREIERLRRDLKMLLGRLDALKDVYAVLDGDTVITLAHAECSGRRV